MTDLWSGHEAESRASPMPAPPAARVRLTLPRLLLVAASVLVLVAVSYFILLAVSSLVLGYTPVSPVQQIPRFVDVTFFLLVLIGVIGAGGFMLAQFARKAVADRRSIRSELMVSHLVAVTASTFVYATGGFFLLIAVLYLSGYSPPQMVQLIPQFFGITVFVLVQIALITMCGIVVARLVSRIVSRPMLRQIAELEERSNAVAAGQLGRKVEVLTDDELGRLAQRFNDLISQLSSADNQRRAFVANISHDLRTPIAVIRGHLDAQRDADGTDDIAPEMSFMAIEHEVATLSRLIDDLFTLSRLEEGVLPVQAIPVDLVTLATEAVAAVRPYALKTARVSVHLQIEDALPNVIGDPTRIAQIINNLLHNAVRHTPEGGLVVLQATAQPDRSAVDVTVRDTGVGIAPDVLDRIFDRYYQGETIGEKGGAGLGLSIVKQLVEMQGGSVWAESRPGEGTAVTFRLVSTLGSRAPV